METAAALSGHNTHAALFAELRALLGDRLSTAVRARAAWQGRVLSRRPCAGCGRLRAQTTEEVSAIVKACARHETPVIPFGTGTSLEGHVAALHGGICIDLSQMNRVLRVNVEDLDVAVQPGVTRKQLNNHLKEWGCSSRSTPAPMPRSAAWRRRAPPAPTRSATAPCARTCSGLTVVLADGRIIRTGGRARKSAAGYDLTRLFVGSEGTLGVITEITLRLYGIPESISAAVGSFPTIEDAVDTVIQTIQSGIPVARIELLDDVQMDAINRYAKLDYPVQSTLFFEFHGTQAGVAEQAEMVRAIAAEHGAGDFRWATKPEERNKLWQARHDAYYAAKALRPGGKGWATDVCVPISRLAECISETKKEICGLDADRADRRPCRRRQFPPLLHHRSRTIPRRWPQPRPSMTAWSCGRWRSAAPARASMASATASSTS